MILKEFYAQKKSLISTLLNEGKNSQDPKKNITVGLYNDVVFKPKTNVAFPLVLFKYNHIDWNTSSENEYKADVDFSVFIALNTGFENDYLEVFDMAKLIDKAILLHPTKSELEKNKEALNKGETTSKLITNSALKIKECQSTVKNDNWEKNEFFIWEINYKTTLVEKSYKKRYTMISNGAFLQTDLATKEKKEKLRKSLLALGYDLNDYHEVEVNGKKLLEIKEIEEKLIVNKKKK